jgi:hypothetical protein
MREQKILSRATGRACSRVALRSEGGLNCKLEISKPSAAEPLHKVISALKQTTHELPRSATYVKTSTSRPTIAFLSVFLLLALAQAAILSQGTFREFDNLNTQPPSRAAQEANTRTGSQEPQRTPIPGNGSAVHPQPGGIPFDSKPPSVLPSSQQPAAPSAEDPQQALDLTDVGNLLWVQSRLQSLGFMRARTKAWDAPTRSALRDFKATNNLRVDDKWDLNAEELLASGAALRADQTFVGAWSEAGCEPGSKPDITINSRRAVSSTGGVCDFSNLRQAGSSWSVATTCTNAGEKWSANVQLAVSAGRLIWKGRDGTATEYSRCR